MKRASPPPWESSLGPGVTTGHSPAEDHVADVPVPAGCVHEPDCPSSPGPRSRAGHHAERERRLAVPAGDAAVREGELGMNRPQSDDGGEGVGGRSARPAPRESCPVDRSVISCGSVVPSSRPMTSAPIRSLHGLFSDSVCLLHLALWIPAAGSQVLQSRGSTPVNIAVGPSAMTCIAPPGSSAFSPTSPAGACG